MKQYKSLDEYITYYKSLKLQYHTQLNRLIAAEIPDPDMYINNLYRELVDCGRLLEGNGVDIEKLNEEFDTKKL